MAKTSFPPGFRFHPTDIELVVYYLKRKVLGKKIHVNFIAEVDAYKYAPWDLPDKSCLKSKDLKWYFFCAREKKYANGARMKRATDFGYWKATGKDRSVQYNGKVVGMIKTLIFHQGRPPQGNRTDWVMHEYRLEDKDLVDKGVIQDAYVLVVVFQKDGIGPRNGAQYGAPFREEEWSDDEEVDCCEPVSSASPSMPAMVPAHNQVSHVTATAHFPESICIGTVSDLCLSDARLPSCNVLPIVSSASMNDPQVQWDDDLDLLLAQFTEDGARISNETNSIKQKLDDNASQKDDVKALTLDFDPDDFFKDLELGVPGNLGAAVSEGGSNFSTGFKPAYPPTDVHDLDDDMSYLELLDLDVPLNFLTGVTALEYGQSDGSYVVRKCHDNGEAQ